MTDLISLAEARQHLPHVHGQPISICTLWRWATKGLNGVKLEHRRMGGRIFTREEWLDQFGAALAEAGPRRRPRRQSQPKGRTPKQREQAVAQAEAKMGVGA